MANPFRRALTRRRFENGRFTVEEAQESLVYLVEFGVAATACLTALEIASVAFLHVWNAEVFASISAISGIVLGVFAGRKA